MLLQITVPKPYDFASSVRDHGWIALAPFRWHDDESALQRVERLRDGKVVLLTVTATDANEAVQVSINVQTDGDITPAEQAEILEKVRWMLKLDEDFADFYALVARDPELAAKLIGGRGRLLRSPTLFEDVVKTICTTNTNWAQTKGMVARLVARVGDSYPLDPERHAFPTPDQVAAAGEDVFQTDIRLGYRNAYILQLARELAEGRCDLEALKTSSLPVKELKKELKSIMGVGDYAAHTLMMILGRYDEVAVDSELRSFVGKKYGAGGALTEKEMVAIYEGWGRWKYLAYWFDAS